MPLGEDVHVRRDVDELFPAEGIKTVATDIREGVVYEEHGVNVLIHEGGAPKNTEAIEGRPDEMLRVSGVVFWFGSTTIAPFEIGAIDGR